MTISKLGIEKKQKLYLNNLDLHIELLTDKQEIPFDLLELADPSRTQIKSYLTTGNCYVAKIEAKIVGAIILSKIDSTTIEIKNIAVREAEQGKGIGKALLKYAEKISQELEYKKLIIGTGNSSIGQLALYQKSGFEISSIEYDFFILNYDELIIENGIPCKHMILLKKILNE